LRRVPADGELTVLNWRHNLGQGASPDFIADAGLEGQLSRIAEQSLSALGLRCGSVDVLSTPDSLQVLEVNNGIMVENLARSGVHGASLAKATYCALIRKLLDLDLDL
jgi:glutathione synthase/RimK-type ligase-like ATP-grasp enzyme